MARVVATAPPPAVSAYRWHQYADGRHWELQAGEDFTVSTREVVRAAKRWAVRNGYHCQAQQRRGAVTVRFTQSV